MNETTTEQQLTRRRMLAGIGAATLLTAELARGQQSQSAASDSDSKNTGSKPLTNPGPKNQPVLDENPDSYQPPSTDAGDVDTFKYSFGLGHNRVSDGGWARQVTVRDLKISTSLAGVNMRLEAGAVRELHWHIPAEWAFMITGSARITAVDSQSRSFVEDLDAGDLWYFPGGIPHSIQGLGPDGCEFLLVFDDGRFSEFDTFLITDWMAHTPREVLSKNFNMPENTFEPLPKKELYIFRAPLPNSLEEDKKAAIGSSGAVPESFLFKMSSMKPTKEVKGGSVKIVDSFNFAASKTVSAALVTLKPGALRELHWHPNADEWQYYVAGKGRMTVFTGGGKARTMDFQANDVGYIQQSLPHYIENTGNSDLVFLEIFKSDRYEDISLSEWISHLPPELVSAHLKLPETFSESITKEKAIITPT